MNSMEQTKCVEKKVFFRGQLSFSKLRNISVLFEPRLDSVLILINQGHAIYVSFHSNLLCTPKIKLFQKVIITQTVLLQIL